MRETEHRCELCDDGRPYLINHQIDSTKEGIQICPQCSDHLDQLNWDKRNGPFHRYSPIEKVQKTKQLLSQRMNS